MPHLARRGWTPAECEDYVQRLASDAAGQSSAELDAALTALIGENRQIHEHDCINLNPATNLMNPKAEAALASGLGARPSLGYPGDKYEMGLEAIEQIEVICAELAAEIFAAPYAEVRVASGALANLYTFMATTRPGGHIIAPPAAIGGHVTHHDAGAAGLYGVTIHEAPVDPNHYTVDIDALAALARDVKPDLITLGGSLNLTPHPVAAVREIADEVGAKVLFDAAHLCGIIAGGVWDNPLDLGAHVMTMSTYKSLGGPPGGLLVCNDAELAERIDAVAFPGLTANFDVAKTAALAITLLDWRDFGTAYGERMRDLAITLAHALMDRGVAVFQTADGPTRSHQFAVEAAALGGGHAAAKRLRRANLLTSAIGLPIAPVTGDANGVRFGTPEIARMGMTEDDMPALADLIHRGLTDDDPAAVAAETAALRGRFTGLEFVRP